MPVVNEPNMRSVRVSARQVHPPSGFPIRLKAPTKLGLKQPKQIIAIEVTNTNPGGYWENRGFNWFSGI